jgi:outer membrane protein assembly factor BamB
MILSEKDIRILNGVSMVSGVFTLVIAFIMIFSLLQLKIINPLDSPALMTVKDQYDKDPASRDKAEQVRAMDLMARKAYFSSRWQVETGSYLLIAGVVIYVLCQRLVAGNEKPAPSFPENKPELFSQKTKSRKYLIVSASVITVAAIISSFILRTNLPAPGRASHKDGAGGGKITGIKSPEPDKTNWPFFRGEGSRGIGAGSGYPTEWDGPGGKNIKWKMAVAKHGKSSPVIWGDRLFVTGAEGKECEVYCIDKNSGKMLWTASATNMEGTPAEIPDMDADAGMAVSTMAVNGKVACAIFGNGNLICLDMNGKQKWARNLGLPKNTYGYSSSLLISGDLLLIQYDTDEKVSVIGIDLVTGAQKWETLRKGRPAWASPILANFDGTAQMLINGNPNVSAYDPVNGTELWSLPGVSGDVAPSLAANSKMVYAVTDYAKLIALKPGKTGSMAWEDNTYTPDVSSPVANDKYLFVSTGNGDVGCYNAETGDTLWGRFFDNPFYASPIICDDKVWMLDREGIMHILEASEKFNIIATSPLGEKTDCTPVFSEKKIYLRGKENIFCISKN